MRALLIIRGFVGVWFGLRFWLLDDPSANIFETLADYLFVDGVAGLLVGGAVLSEGVVRGWVRERTLGAVLFVDALGRITSGVVVHVLPGTTDFPVTAVMFLTIMAACTAMVGFTEAGLIVREEVGRHGPAHERPQFSIAPVLLASIASTVFGAALVWTLGDADAMRPLLAGYVVAAGLVMFALAWSRRALVTRRRVEGVW